MKSNSFIRFISLFLLAAFFAQDLAFANPDLGLLQGSEKEKNLKWASEFLPQIPSSIATIEDAWKQGEQTVVLIQDAHTNASCQLNTAKLLDLIFKKMRVSSPHSFSGDQNDSRLRGNDKFVVFSEAATGENSLSFLRDQAPLETRKQIARKYLQKGFLHGVEYLDLTSDYPIHIQGVESPELYLKSIDVYRDVAARREAFLDYLSKVDSTIAALKSKSLNPVLLKMVEDRSAFQKNELKITEYLDRLSEQAQLNQIPLKNYPEIRRVTTLIKIKSGIDWNKTSRLKKIRTQKLLDELKTLEVVLFEKLCVNQDEKDFLGAMRHAELLRKLLNLTLSPLEFGEYQQFKGVSALTGLLNQRIVQLEGPYDKALFLQNGFDAFIQKCETFYELTLKRDEVFVQGIDNTKEPLSILIIGGYHSANLKRLLRAKNISYISVIPQVTHETNQKRYEKILLNQRPAPMVSPMSGAARLMMQPYVMGTRLAASPEAREILLESAFQVNRKALEVVRSKRMKEHLPVRYRLYSDKPLVLLFSNGSERSVVAFRLEDIKTVAERWIYFGKRVNKEGRAVAVLARSKDEEEVPETSKEALMIGKYKGDEGFSRFIVHREMEDFKVRSSEGTLEIEMLKPLEAQDLLDYELIGEGPVGFDFKADIQMLQTQRDFAILGASSDFEKEHVEWLFKNFIQRIEKKRYQENDLLRGSLVDEFLTIFKRGDLADRSSYADWLKAKEILSPREDLGRLTQAAYFAKARYDERDQTPIERLEELASLLNVDSDDDRWKAIREQFLDLDLSKQFFVATGIRSHLEDFQKEGGEVDASVFFKQAQEILTMYETTDSALGESGIPGIGGEDLEVQKTKIQTFIDREIEKINLLEGHFHGQLEKKGEQLIDIKAGRQDRLRLSWRMGEIRDAHAALKKAFGVLKGQVDTLDRRTQIYAEAMAKLAPLDQRIARCQTLFEELERSISDFNKKSAPVLLRSEDELRDGLALSMKAAKMTEDDLGEFLRALLDKRKKGPLADLAGQFQIAASRNLLAAFVYACSWNLGGEAVGFAYLFRRIYSRADNASQRKPFDPRTISADYRYQIFLNEIFSRLRTLVYSPDKRIAVVQYWVPYEQNGQLHFEKKVKLVDTQSGHNLEDKLGSKNNLKFISFSPDGQKIFINGDEKILDTASLLTADVPIEKTWRPIMLSPDKKFIVLDTQFEGVRQIKIIHHETGSDCNSLISGIQKIKTVHFDELKNSGIIRGLVASGEEVTTVINLSEFDQRVYDEFKLPKKSGARLSKKTYLDPQEILTALLPVTPDHIGALYPNDGTVSNYLYCVVPGERAVAQILKEGAVNYGSSYANPLLAFRCLKEVAPWGLILEVKRQKADLPILLSDVHRAWAVKPLTEKAGKPEHAFTADLGELRQNPGLNLEMIPNDQRLGPIKVDYLSYKLASKVAERKIKNAVQKEALRKKRLDEKERKRAEEERIANEKKAQKEISEKEGVKAKVKLIEEASRVRQKLERVRKSREATDGVRIQKKPTEKQLTDYEALKAQVRADRYKSAQGEEGARLTQNPLLSQTTHNLAKSCLSAARQIRTDLDRAHVLAAEDRIVLSAFEDAISGMFRVPGVHPKVAHFLVFYQKVGPARQVLEKYQHSVSSQSHGLAIEKLIVDINELERGIARLHILPDSDFKKRLASFRKEIDGFYSVMGYSWKGHSNGEMLTLTDLLYMSLDTVRQSEKFLDHWVLFQRVAALDKKIVESPDAMSVFKVDVPKTHQMLGDFQSFIRNQSVEFGEGSGARLAIIRGPFVLKDNVEFHPEISLEGMFAHQKSGQGVLLAQVLEKQFGALSNLRSLNCLDIATGRGMFMLRLKESLEKDGVGQVYVTGVEKDHEAIQWGDDIRSIQEDVVNLKTTRHGLAPASFDLITMNAPILYSSKDKAGERLIAPIAFEKWLSSAKFFLKPNGIMLIRLYENDDLPKSSLESRSLMRIESILLKQALDRDTELEYEDIGYLQPSLRGAFGLGSAILVRRKVGGARLAGLITHALPVGNDGEFSLSDFTEQHKDLKFKVSRFRPAVYEEPGSGKRYLAYSQNMNKTAQKHLQAYALATKVGFQNMTEIKIIRDASGEDVYLVRLADNYTNQEVYSRQTSAEDFFLFCAFFEWWFFKPNAGEEMLYKRIVKGTNHYLITEYAYQDFPRAPEYLMEESTAYTIARSLEGRTFNAELVLRKIEDLNLAPYQKNILKKSVNLIFKELIRRNKQGRIAEKNLDRRASKGYLLSEEYIRHDMAVKRIVNPKNQPLRVLYGGSGIDVSNVLLSTNATEIYFMDKNSAPPNLADLEEYMNLSEGDKRATLNSYLTNKFSGGYAVYGDFAARNISVGLFYEMQAVGADMASIHLSKNSSGLVELEFDWRYKGDRPKRRKIIFIRADTTQVESYKKYFDNAQGNAFDVYYQRAGMGIAKKYSEKNNFVERLSEFMSPNGFFVTDDNYDDDGFRKAVFPLRDEPIATLELNLAAEIAELARVSRSYIDYPKEDPTFHYGWDVTIRKNSKFTRSDVDLKGVFAARLADKKIWTTHSSVSGDGKWLLEHYSDNTAMIYDARTRRDMGWLIRLADPDWYIHRIYFSPSSRYAEVIYYSKHIDNPAYRSKPWMRHRHKLFDLSRLQDISRAIGRRANWMHFSPDEGLLIVTDYYNRGRIFKMDPSKGPQDPRSIGKNIRYGRVSADNQKLALVFYNKTAQVLDAQTLTPLPISPDSDVSDVEFSPDSKTIELRYIGGNKRIFKIKEGSARGARLAERLAPDGGFSFRAMEENGSIRVDVSKNGKSIGFARFKIDGQKASFHVVPTESNIVVDKFIRENYRGIGSVLVARCLELAKSRGIKIVEVKATSDALKRFYEGLGFSPTYSWVDDEGRRWTDWVFDFDAKNIPIVRIEPKTVHAGARLVNNSKFFTGIAPKVLTDWRKLALLENDEVRVYSLKRNKNILIVVQPGQKPIRINLANERRVGHVNGEMKFEKDLTDQLQTILQKNSLKVAPIASPHTIFLQLGESPVTKLSTAKLSNLLRHLKLVMGDSSVIVFAGSDDNKTMATEKVRELGMSSSQITVEEKLTADAALLPRTHLVLDSQKISSLKVRYPEPAQWVVLARDEDPNMAGVFASGQVASYLSLLTLDLKAAYDCFISANPAYKNLTLSEFESMVKDPMLAAKHPFLPSLQARVSEAVKLYLLSRTVTTNA